MHESQELKFEIPWTGEPGYDRPSEGPSREVTNVDPKIVEDNLRAYNENFARLFPDKPDSE